MTWNFGTLHYAKPDHLELVLPGDQSYAEFVGLVETMLLSFGYELHSQERETTQAILTFKRFT